MEKQYIYRKHIRIMQKVMPAFLGCLAVIILIASIVVASFMKNELNKILVLIPGVFLFFIVSIEALFIWFIFRRFTKVSVKLTEDYLIYTNIKGETTVPIDQIQKLEYPSIPYIGGWLKIIYPGGNIRLTVVLENIGDLLRKLKMNLDSKGNQCYNRKDMFNFYKTAEYSDQSWERVYEIFVKILLLTFLSIFLGVLLYILSGQPKIMVFWALASAILPLITWLIAEIVFMVKSASGSNEEKFEVKPRDRVYEKKVYTLSFAVYAVLYFLVSAAMLLLSYLQ